MNQCPLLRPAVAFSLALMIVLGVAQPPQRALASEKPATRLSQVRERVKALRSAARQAVVIFDLDDTLFRVTPRTKAILGAWAVAEQPADTALAASIAALDPEQMAYALAPTLAKVGLAGTGREAAAKAYWMRWFFASKFLPEDPPIAGAREYVLGLHRAGAHICYLSGRDERMEAGTLAALRRHGFPTPGPRVSVFLKDDPKRKDVEFKAEALAMIGGLGTVVAAFDNEPANVNLYHRQFPEAATIYLDVAHSDGAPPVDAGIPSEKNFLDQ